MRPRKCMWPNDLATCVTKQGNITSIIRSWKPKCKPGNNLGVVNQGNITYHYGSSVSVYMATLYDLFNNITPNTSNVNRSREGES